MRLRSKKYKEFLGIEIYKFSKIPKLSLKIKRINRNLEKTSYREDFFKDKPLISARNRL